VSFTNQPSYSKLTRETSKDYCNFYSLVATWTTRCDNAVKSTSAWPFQSCWCDTFWTDSTTSSGMSSSTTWSNSPISTSFSCAESTQCLNVQCFKPKCTRHTCIHCLCDSLWGMYYRKYEFFVILTASKATWPSPFRRSLSWNSLSTNLSITLDRIPAPA
jgi:hypothetical protein